MRSCAAVVAFLLALEPCAPATAQSPDHWVSGRTSHFTVVSNADARSVQRLASNLERFVAVTAPLLGADAAPAEPVTVVAFRDDRTFRPFKPLYNGKPGNLSGFFEHSQDETIIALDISAARQFHPFAVIFHEYTHLLTNRSGRSWPPWVREGLAEYYSTFLAQDGQVTLGLPIADHVRLFRRGRLLGLAQLLAVDRESPIYNTGERQSLFYAQSWALVHYLMVKRDLARPSQVGLFLRAMTAGRSAEQAFRETIRAAYPALEAELRGYISREIYPVASFRMDIPPAAAEFALQPLSASEREVHLGRLLLHIGRLDEAETFFARARSLDDASPTPFEGLGFLALRRGHAEVAFDHFRQAAARGSRNHVMHYLHGDRLFRQVRDGRLTSAQARAILAQASAAARLEPRFLPARHLMARVSLTLGSEADWLEAAGMMTDARAAFPTDARIALTLGNLQLQLREFEAARANLLLVAGSADEALNDQARYLLSQIPASPSRPAWTAPEIADAPASP